MDRDRLLARTRDRGVNPVVYWLVRAVLQPFFHVYFRVSRLGREHAPKHGGLIIAANHRSFLDPFVIATMVRRPVYFVAKRELFAHPLQSWLLNALGAFPIDRGNGDGAAMETARAILARGDVVVIFPEGTRVRPGPLGAPRRGVGRLALETGAPVLPVAVIGTERIRRGWRFRPHKVRIRAGRPLTFPRVDSPSPALARAVTDRIWPCVALQWEWLGGAPPVRRAAVIGAEAPGAAAARALARAGIEVDLACATAEQAAVVGAARRVAGLALPDAVHVSCADDLDLEREDLVCFAGSDAALAAAVAAHGARIARGAGVLVLAQGPVAPHGTGASAYVAERTTARAVATVAVGGDAADLLAEGASVVVASPDRAFARQLTELMRSAGLETRRPGDVVAAGFGEAALAQDDDPATARRVA